MFWLRERLAGGEEGNPGGAADRASSRMDARVAPIARREREAQRAEAQVILDAIRRGDRSRVMTAEELIQEMNDARDDAEEPGA